MEANKVPDSPTGNYSLPPSYKVESGDTSDVSQHNPPFEDVAQAVTNRLHRDGRTSWTGDQNANGFKVTGLAQGTNPGDAVSVAQLGSFSLPIGAIVDYGGAIPPDNWLLCDGQAISRTSFALLFEALGTAHGVGDGTTTFNIPDLRGRVTAGLDNMGGTDAARLDGPIDATTLGASGGLKEHVLTEAQIPSHTHTVTDPGHTHAVTDPGHRHPGGATSTGSLSGTVSSAPGYAQTATATTGITIASSPSGISIGSRGGDTAHPNVQPTMVLNKIIKAR